MVEFTRRGLFYTIYNTVDIMIMHLTICQFLLPICLRIKMSLLVLCRYKMGGDDDEELLVENPRTPF